jgi:hypothetical protein
MPSLSIDHEFLTKDGWKRKITVDDELATFACPCKPETVTMTPNDAGICFIQNSRINLYALDNLRIYNKTDPVTITDCFTSAQEFTVISDDAENAIEATETTDTLEAAETIMMQALVAGKHASIIPDERSTRERYIVTTYATDILFDPSQKTSDTIYLASAPGTSIITIQMPINTPICTRRHGKCCWIMGRDL